MPKKFYSSLSAGLFDFLFSFWTTPGTRTARKEECPASGPFSIGRGRFLFFFLLLSILPIPLLAFGGFFPFSPHLLAESACPGCFPPLPIILPLFYVLPNYDLGICILRISIRKRAGVLPFCEGFPHHGTVRTNSESFSDPTRGLDPIVSPPSPLVF